MGQFTVGGGIDFIQAGADDSNAGTGTAQSSPVRRRVDAMCHAAHNAQAGSGNSFRKRFRIAQTLGSSVAATDNGKRARIQ